MLTIAAQAPAQGASAPAAPDAAPKKEYVRWVADEVPGLFEKGESDLLTGRAHMQDAQPFVAKSWVPNERLAECRNVAVRAELSQTNFPVSDAQREMYASALRDALSRAPGVHLAADGKGAATCRLTTSYAVSQSDIPLIILVEVLVVAYDPTPTGSGEAAKLWAVAVRSSHQLPPTPPPKGTSIADLLFPVFKKSIDAAATHYLSTDKQRSLLEDAKRVPLPN